MVFETIVADLLNRVLGDYIQNLDRSQLQIGIFGGDVVLQNLIVKQSALDDLNLPVRTVYGQIGKLILKIPWRNLYSAPVEAKVERVFLLVIPNQEIKYDAEKEEKLKQDAKQAGLNRFEDLKKFEREKDKVKTSSSFAEKLIAQIIKNVQVYIEDIHIRYEDHVSNPNSHFSLGFTLHNLTVHSTDENWKSCVVQETAKMIHKVLEVEGLAVYWNCKSESFPHPEKNVKDLVSAFKHSIWSKERCPANFTYILGPINSMAKLRLNPKPEQDGSNFSIPKVFLLFELEKLGIGISKDQYRDIIELLESMDRMSCGSQYRKYRPFLNTYRGHYKKWWKFAYVCILEEDVRRKHRNWNWEHMKRHRDLCRKYAVAYKGKLNNDTKAAQELEILEKDLDLFNLIIIRQRVDMEEERLLAAKEKQQKGGWFSSWWSSDTSGKDDLSAAAIAKKFEAAMTPEEKKKLFRAIDYQENAAPIQYPPEFVEIQASFMLRFLDLEVRDDTYSYPSVLLADLSNVCGTLETRPAASALKACVSIHTFTVFGLDLQTKRSRLISSKNEENDSDCLLDVSFEKNPMGGGCDQRIRVKAEPLRVIYDASTINKLADIFKPPAESKAISNLQAAASLRLAELKEMSATGLQYAIEKHSILDLDVIIKGSHILLPYGGSYDTQGDLLVVDLGCLTVQSVVRDQKAFETVNKMFSHGSTEDEILKSMMSHSYDKFVIGLKNVQVLVVFLGEDWEELLKRNVSPSHLLHPTTLLVHFNKCLIPDDPRLPKIAIAAQLPSVYINVSDERLFHLVALFTSIPLPSEDDVQATLQETASISSSLSGLSKLIENKTDAHRASVVSRIKTPALEKDIVQAIDLEAKFEMKELRITMFKQLAPVRTTLIDIEDNQKEQEEEDKVFDFRVLNLEMELVQRTYDMTATLRLGGLAFEIVDPVSEVVRLIDTPMLAGEMEYLLNVKFVSVNRKSPELHTRHNSVLQLLAVDLSRVTVQLHQEGLTNLIKYSQYVTEQIDEIKAQGGAEVSKLADAGKLGTIFEDTEVQAVTKSFARPPVVAKRARKKVSPVVETVDFKLTANMHNLEVIITSRFRDLASAAVLGISATIAVKKPYTEIVAHLSNVLISDPDQHTIYNKIVSVIGDEALSAEVVKYNLDENEDDADKFDMTVKVSTACIRVVFLNCFVTKLLEFMSSFQEAQQTVIDAARDAAVAAKQNMQEAYTKAVRIRLDIELNAPNIVIPANSHSVEALLLDFGHLTIKNKCHNLAVEDSSDTFAVLDDINIGLHNLNISRIKMDTTKSCMETKSTILQPITLALKVKRNLSASWYNNIPDLEIVGHLTTILVTLSQEDFCMAMKVLTGNLAEGATTTGTSGVQKESVSRPRSTKFELEMEPAGRESTTGEQKQDDLVSVTTTLKFTFTMESLVIDLFTGGSNGVDESQMNTQGSRQGLARFTLHVLSLRGRMRSDGSLALAALLVDCLMDDTREGRQKALTCLMQRKRSDSSEESSVQSSPNVRSSTVPEESARSMLDLVFQRKGDDTFVDVRVFGFDLVLSTEFLTKVANFFTVGLAKAAAESSSMEEALKAKRTSARSTIRSSVVNRAAQAPVKAKGGMMTVNLRVEKPDIIVVESMDDINTNGLILNNEITFKLRLSETHQVITGSIKDFELYTCCYNPEKRKETMAQILRPCTIALAGSTPEGEGLHLDLSVTDIRISVSPATIELLSRVQRSITPSSAEGEGEEDKEVHYGDIWMPKEYQDSDFWFFSTEIGQDVVEDLTDEITAEETQPVFKSEVCIVSAPSIIITVEAGVGNQTLPMLLLEMGFQGDIRNWSSQLSIDSNLGMQMAYYNSYLAVWEPLIEPVEVLRDGKPSRTLWELRAELTMNSAEPVHSPTTSTLSSDEIEEIPYQPPAMTIEILSKENLELTISKTCLEVLKNLGKAFQSAVSGELPMKYETVAPYSVRNNTGLAVTLLLEEGPFQLVEMDGTKSYIQVMLENGASVGLCLKEGEQLPDLGGRLIMNSASSPSTPEHQSSQPARLLSVKLRILDRDCILELPVSHADKRYFALQHRGENNDPWGLISEVAVEGGGTVITLRSVIQICNHFSEPVDVYYMTRRGNEVERVGTVGRGQTLNLPLYAVYTLTNELFFSVSGYTVSVVPFVWKELQNMLSATKLLQCNPKDTRDRDPFFMRIVGEMEQVFFEQTRKHTIASVCYNVHLRPAMLLKNKLPVEVIFCLSGSAKESNLAPGLTAQVATGEPGNSSLIIRIPEYLEKEWMCKNDILNSPPEFAVWTFDSYDSVQKVSMDLGIHTVVKKGTIIMSLYCPFWMLNKTGMMLSYRKSRKTEKTESTGSPLKQSDEPTNVLYHPDNFKGPILFSFHSKSFFGKKTASIKVEDGEWSDKFSLDVAGSSGVVNCKYGETVYQIGVSIQLTYSGLTKQVTFTPYYVLLNEAKFLVECREDGRDDPWTKAPSMKCAVFWPRSINNDNRMLTLRVPGESGETSPFSISIMHTTLLKLHNKYGGVNVDVQITEGGVYIKFTPYEPGLAPALIINHITEPVVFTEKGCQESITLQPYQQVMFTWEKPAGAKELQWFAAKKKEISTDLRKDIIDKMTITGEREVWWVSFLDGLQRVLLLTTDLTVATACQSAAELEPFDREIKVAIHGIGLSLVNNITHTEVMYIGIASSGIIWETSKLKSSRFKPLGTQESAAIEQAYERYTYEVLLGKQTQTSKCVVLDGKLEVDFKAEEIIKPKRARLRRTYNTGLWLQLKSSPHQIQLHAKVNRLQIDNQMFDCMFPVVLAPVPPPKSVVADNAMKPFAEVSIVERIMEYSSVKQYKYFKVLIQEFHIKLDMGFVNGILQILMEEEISDEQEEEQFKSDLKLVDEPLLSRVAVISSQEQKNFYDLLHFSPLKIHLSFSLSSNDQQRQQTQLPLFLNVLLRSLGVTLTDMQDVVFKLAFFERQYVFLTQQKLISEATMHYVGQSLKQLYVLVLGLDVLGNPYGLVVGLTQGVEALFYEPFQGAIQGPGEFAEGLVLGVRSLFGHTVGGAAGAFSRITGAVGKGIAALTFDEEYQKKRRAAMRQRAPNVQTGLARSGKGLVMGVVDGVTGVFVKPITGAREEGVEGFFKGMGKGMVGLVTRPAAGVVDFASGSLDAVKRVTEIGDEVFRLRPPRFLRPDGMVRPYVRLEAEGNRLLQIVDKNKYASTDIYICHMNISKDYLLLTDKRIIYISHNDIFGGWQTEWSYTWDVLAQPRLLDKGVLITTGESKKKMLGFFGSGDSGKVLLVKDPLERQWLISKIKEMIKK